MWGPEKGRTGIEEGVEVEVVVKLRHNPVSVMHNPSLSIVSLLLSPEMRSHAGMAKQTRGRRLRFTQEFAPS